MLGIVDDLDGRDFAWTRAGLQTGVGRRLHGRDGGFGHGARRRARREVRRVCVGGVVGRVGGAILHLLVGALVRARTEHLAWRRRLGMGEGSEGGGVHGVARIMRRVRCEIGGEDG